MINLFGVVLFILGAVCVMSGFGVEKEAQSAIHQIYAALLYTGGGIVASLGIVTAALGAVAGRLKSIDEKLNQQPDKLST